MAIREKLRNTFRRGSSSTSTSSCDSNEVKRTDTNNMSKREQRKAEKAEKKRQKELYYQPGEAMPWPKYPGRVDKDHQERLMAFTFTDAWSRRSSYLSSVSPMASRSNSVTDCNSISRRPLTRGGKQPSAHLETIQIADRDDDIANVGLSRQVTTDSSNWRRESSSVATAFFNASALSKALTASHLEVAVA